MDSLDCEALQDDSNNTPQPKGFGRAQPTEVITCRWNRLDGPVLVTVSFLTKNLVKFQCYYQEDYLPLEKNFSKCQGPSGTRSDDGSVSIIPPKGENVQISNILKTEYRQKDSHFSFFCILIALFRNLSKKNHLYLKNRGLVG